MREIVHTSVGGGQARVWLSNRFGSEPLRIGAAHIAMSANAKRQASQRMEVPMTARMEARIQAGSDRALTFNRMASVVIPPGAEIVSDPVALDVPALSNMAVSIYFPDHTMATTEHADAAANLLCERRAT